MNKNDFLVQLQMKLGKYGITNSSQYVGYYSEYLDDLMENGYSEQDAVQKVGTPEKVLLSVLADNDVQIPKMTNRLQTILLLLGAPIWGPVMIAGYIILCALILTALICSIAFLIAGTWLLLGSIVVLIKIGVLNFLFQLGMSFLFIGLSVISEQLFLYSFQVTVNLIKKTFVSVNERRAH